MFLPNREVKPLVSKEIVCIYSQSQKEVLPADRIRIV